MEVPIDLSRLPETVRDGLAVAGFWACPRDLRDDLACWDDLDERDRAAAVNSVELLAAALAR